MILWLSVWAVEDYLNNVYVKAYVDGFVQAESWMFGLLAFVGVLGSVMGLVVHRKRSSKSVELEIGTSSRTSGPSGPISKSPVSTPSPIAAKVPAQSAGPSVELHPAVAALKAELSEARMSLGLASVTTGSDKPAGQSSRFDDQKPMAGAQPPTLQHYAMTPPRPQPAVASQTPTPMMRPSLSPGSSFRQVPPTVIRPYAQQGPTSLPVPSPAAPVLRIEKPPQPLPVQTTPPNAQPVSAEPTVKDAPTVITGIVPDPQKKKESDSGNQKTESQ
jgi:hypothetical protein